MNTQARDLHAELLEAAYDRIKNSDLSDDDLAVLHFVFGPLLMPALNLVDRGEVHKIKLPNGRFLYQVAGAKGKQYVVHPANLTTGNAYCPCTAFTYSCLLTSQQLVCKHVLAVTLAEKTGRCQTIEMQREQISALLSST